MPPLKHRMSARTHLKIYESRRHLAVTLFTLIIPFIALLVFSRYAHIAAPVLFKNVFVSVGRLAVAYVIAAALGWLLAVLFYRGKRSAVALPLFDVLQSFPTFAALPIAALYWGPSNFTVIFFLVLAVIWPILFSVTSSLKLIRRDAEDAVQILGLSGWEYVKKFLWPVAVPGLITGSVIGLGDGWEALIATEIIVNVRSGLGNFFQASAQNLSITAFGILAFLIVIFSINKLIWLPLLDRSHEIMEE